MALAPRLAPGSTFARDFDVIELLAEGGMGAVYRVEQRSTLKQRALKLVSARLASDPKGRQRFVREATVGASIESEHVVEVIGAGFDDETGRPWLAMELLDGADLGAVVQHHGSLTPALLREVVAQLVHGLAAAHRAGVVHRDLKPANVFVARSRRAGVPFTIKVLDFGIAKVVQESGTGSSDTDTVGSPLWMAPEQLNAERPTPATDVWALGLLAFWALTGRHYWLSAHAEASTVQALFVEQLFKAIELPSRRIADLGLAVALPAGFDAWFLRCLDREPTRRYADAAEAGAALLELLPHDPAVADQLLPEGSIAPSPGHTEPHGRHPGITETTLPGERTAWDASAVVPAAALQAARSAFEATHADPIPLGADLSQGPVPGLHPKPSAPRRRVPAWLVTASVATVVIVLLGGAYLAWELQQGSLTIEVQRTDSAASEVEPLEPPSPPTVVPEAADPQPDEATEAATEADPGTAEPSGPMLDLVVPLRNQLGEEAYDVEFLGWSPEGHRFALQVEYRDDRDGVHNRLTLVQVHDALTGAAIESYLVSRDAPADFNRFNRLSKAAKEAKPHAEWTARRKAMSLHKRGPKRKSPQGGSLRIESEHLTSDTSLSFPPSALGVAYRWSGLTLGPDEAPRHGPTVTVSYQQDEQRWELLELPAPFSYRKVAENHPADATEAPHVVGRVLAYWSPAGRRVVLVFEADARPGGAEPLRHRRWALRGAGPQIRVVEAGAGQKRGREVAVALGEAGLPVAELLLREPPVAESTVLVHDDLPQGATIGERIHAAVPTLPAARLERVRGWAPVVVRLGHDAEP